MKRILLGTATVLAMTGSSVWADCGFNTAVSDGPVDLAMSDKVLVPSAVGGIGLLDDVTLVDVDVPIEEAVRSVGIEPVHSTFVTDPVILANAPDIKDRTADLLTVADVEIMVEPDAAAHGMQTATWIYKTPRGHDLGLPGTGEQVMAMSDATATWPATADSKPRVETAS